MRTTLQTIGGLLIGLMGVSLPGLAQEANWPTREVTVLVGAAPGGGSDIATRVFAKYIESRLGKPVIVKNVVGGAGLLVASQLATTKPDGYTMALFGPLQISNVPLQQEVPYDPWKSFDVVGQIFDFGYAVLVPTNSPIKSVEELIAAGKTRPVTYTASTPSIAMAMFQLAGSTGAKLRMVSVTGGSEAMVQAAGGHVDATIGSVPDFTSQVEAGRLRILAVASPERLPKFPEVKTLKELGYKARSVGPGGLFYPAGVAPEIRNRIEGLLKDAAADPQVQDQCVKLSIDCKFSTGQQLAANLKELEGEFKPILRELGLLRPGIN